MRFEHGLSSVPGRMVVAVSSPPTQAMRRILADYACRHRVATRGGKLPLIDDVDVDAIPTGTRADGLIAVDENSAGAGPAPARQGTLPCVSGMLGHASGGTPSVDRES